MPLKCKEIQSSKLKAQWEVDFGKSCVNPLPFSKEVSYTRLLWRSTSLEFA
ncbi:hypothetical protein QJS04_geneDACA011633 [Acorus gramineus]|nr:hypothetical protein QJS04_geneDACA011633 [Acorus gramineus]